jgi:hypothetical protein
MATGASVTRGATVGLGVGVVVEGAVAEGAVAEGAGGVVASDTGFAVFGLGDGAGTAPSWLVSLTSGFGAGVEVGALVASRPAEPTESEHAASSRRADAARQAAFVVGRSRVRRDGVTRKLWRVDVATNQLQEPESPEKRPARKMALQFSHFSK